VAAMKFQKDEAIYASASKRFLFLVLVKSGAKKFSRISG